jgi:sigma-B regulation protein RsbU (phosphoserine phosphatase)
VTIALVPERSGPPTAYYWLSFAVVDVAMPALCLGLAFWVAAVRVRDRQAWLLLLLLLALAEFRGGEWRTIFGRDDVFARVAVVYQPLLANLVPTALLLFGIYFPSRLTLDRRWPWAKWLIIAPILVRVIGEHTLGAALMLDRSAAAIAIDRGLDWTRVPVQFLHLAAVLVFFGAMIYKTTTASSRDERRRLLLLDAGALVGITPLVLFILLTSTGVVQPSEWLVLIALGLLFVFPLSMAYVIVVHRAMEVRVVLRQGVQYVLATGTVRVLRIVLSFAIMIAATSISATADAPLRIALIVVGVALVFGLGSLAHRLGGWIDRRFFREAYEADGILNDLARRVRTMIETGPLLETVATRIAESLHVGQIAILLERGGSFRPAYALGYPSPPSVEIPAQSLTASELRRQQHTSVHFDDAASWVQRVASDERAALERLHAELLVPLSLNEKLLGIMSLGAKQSEEPFSKTDIRLLDSVAAQVGLALENGRLTSAIAAEVAAREKQKRELEIAHEVQERLFPQEYPPIAGFEYAGACRPALGVGGDYYDFILLSPTELGIAIGDVSGKGIPAALLMATLRAYLRGQTIQPTRNLADVVANLNALVYESSAENRYATFFYAEFDSSSRVLKYVNAGHNAPMLFRGEREVLRLDAGGPVVGLMEGCVYQQGSVTLEPGDLFVAYTDGISEALNRADEEWGEERLMDAVRANAGVTTRALIERLMASADAFVAGGPQHDDMTLVIARVT